MGGLNQPFLYTGFSSGRWPFISSIISIRKTRCEIYKTTNILIIQLLSTFKDLFSGCHSPGNPCQFMARAQVR
ncbi:hypothetical protein EYY97_00165 [Hafnia paralvei]|nr:hypothetical protein EYY97_00165 [Hafnia paralvei]